MSDLRPPVLEQRGLIPAVRELCARMHRELEIPVRVEAGPATEIPSDVETLAYRVIQEAMSNVAKHAAASAVEVRLEAVAGTLNVEISDDAGELCVLSRMTIAVREPLAESQGPGAPR